MKVKAFRSTAGIELRPKTGSFRAWRHLAAKENTPMAIPDDDLCPFCGGWTSSRNLEGYGEVWCICKVLEFGMQYDLMLSQFASPMKEHTLDELIPWGIPAFKRVFKNIIGYMNEWLEWPEKWILITGTVGLGKTHMLQSMAQVLRPWSMYVTSGDFESRLFTGLDKSSDYSVENYIYTVSHAPFLFLDDLGAEYGSKFPMAALRRVIDYRYSRPSEYVTVVASNLKLDEFVEYDMRMADRIMDKHIGEVIELEYAESWRRHGHDTI